MCKVIRPGIADMGGREIHQLLSLDQDHDRNCTISLTFNTTNDMAQRIHIWLQGVLEQLVTVTVYKYESNSTKILHPIITMGKEGEGRWEYNFFIFIYI